MRGIVETTTRMRAKAYVWAATDLARFNLSNSANAFIFSDFIPVNAGLLYRATAGLDVGASFRDDLKAAGDTFFIGLLARYYK